MKAFYGNADFRITKRAESFLPPELLARELASTQR